MIFSVVFAQDFEKGLNQTLNQVVSLIKTLGILPNFKEYCEGDVLDCDYFRGYLIIMTGFFMLMDVVASLNPYISFAFAFFVSGWLFNQVPELFSIQNSSIIFRYSFAVMLTYVLFEYIFSFFWGVSKRTREMLVLSTSLIAVFFLDISRLWKTIESFIGSVNTIGFIIFILFLLSMRFFNTYFTLMRVRGALNLRYKAIYTRTAEIAKRAGREMVRGGRR